MCTLILAFQALADAPVAAAANRDERLDRPSVPPRVTVVGDGPDILAPRDQRAGGTWIGTNEAGLFAAITNRWTDEPLSASRSRGLLVDDVLRATSTDDAARVVEEALRTEDYDGFLLTVADAERAILLEWDGHLSVREFGPGIHVVTNVGADDAVAIPPNREDAGRRQVESARRLRADLDPAPDEGYEPWLDRAGAALGDHDYGVCVHGDGYGTRSASLVAIPPDGTTVHRFADGPPCVTAFDDAEPQK